MNATEIANRFKIRCSAIGQIMAGQIGLTDKQASKLGELIKRKTDKDAKPLTANMERELEELQSTLNNPVLPKGAKTYCLGWIKEQPEFYNRKKEVSTKYMEKGLIMEDDALDLVCDVLDYDLLVKNEQHYQDDFITGTPDNIQKDHVIDVKSSWDFTTFPLFHDILPDTAYLWQAIGYMALTGKEKFRLIYCLLDTPINIIEREARNYSYKNGYGDLTQDMLDEFMERMTYENVPNRLKVRVYDFPHDPEKVKQIEERVILCRKFIEETVAKFVN